MSTFPYVARTSNGTLERGIIDATSSDEAKKQIHAKGWTIEEFAGENVGFTDIPSWTTTDRAKQAPKTSAADTTTVYIPLTQTLRLFAGWLMAWYGIIYLAGSYRADGRLPYDIPLIQSLAASDLVLRFAFAVFLFLLMTDLHKWTGSKAILGVLFSIIGVVTMWMFHINV